MKTTVITHAIEPDVMPAFSSIVATTNFSSIQRNQNYHAKTAIVISMVLPAN